MDERPIGVFDSGLGGLTVVKELETILPHENIVYFGDTGRVPYGTRSNQTIEKYARQDIRFLQSFDVKYIIAACGTVSSVAPHVGYSSAIPFVGVVEPTAEAAANSTKNGRIGVIGTTATIRSRAYERALQNLLPQARVFCCDCPLFVPLVENGWFTKADEVAMLTARRYLEPLREEQIDTLILGCTHYPLLWDVIAEVMGSEITLINAGREAARAAADALRQMDLLRTCSRGIHRFFVSDVPDGFNRAAGVLLGRDVSETVERVDIELS